MFHSLVSVSAKPDRKESEKAEIVFTKLHLRFRYPIIALLLWSETSNICVIPDRFLVLVVGCVILETYYYSPFPMSVSETPLPGPHSGKGGTQLETQNPSLFRLPRAGRVTCDLDFLINKETIVFCRGIWCHFWSWFRQVSGHFSSHRGASRLDSDIIGLASFIGIIKVGVSPFAVQPSLFSDRNCDVV